MRPRTKRTKAEREAARILRRNKIEALLGIIDTMEQAPDYPLVMRMAADRHPGFSLKNQLLIIHQRPDASRVAGFHAWRELGRRVRKGATGIAIMIPLTRAPKDAPAKDDDADGDDAPKMRFGTAYVFDIADTEPIPAGTPATEITP